MELRVLEHEYVFDHRIVDGATEAGCSMCALAHRRDMTECLSARPTEWNGLMIVGEGPGATEARLKVPFVGSSGGLLDKLLDKAAIDRQQTYVTNATLCQPGTKPGESWSLTLKDAQVKSGVQHCRPRLLREIEWYQPRVIVALGQAALDAVTGSENRIEKRKPFDCPTCENRRKWKVWRCAKCKPDLDVGAVGVVPFTEQPGVAPTAPLAATPCCGAKWQPKTITCKGCGGLKTKPEVEMRWESAYKIGEVAGGIFRADTLPIASMLKDPAHTYVIPTYHPSFLLRKAETKAQKQIGGQFLAWAALVHFRKAARLLDSEPVFPFRWKQTQDVEELRAYWSRTDVAYAVDIETDSKEALEVTDIRCISMAREDTDEVVVVDTSQLPANHPVVAVVAEFLVDPTKRKIGQNFIYDMTVIERVWQVTVQGFVEDTLVGHNVIAPDEPHDLSHIAFLYTDTPPWKPPKKSKQGGFVFDSKEQLHEYNGRDTRCTALSMKAIRHELDKENARQVHDLDVAKFKLAKSMTERGMSVDRKRMLEIGMEAQLEMEQAQHEMRKLVGRIPDSLVAKDAGADADAFALTPSKPQHLVWALFDREGPFKLTPMKFTDTKSEKWPMGTPQTGKSAVLDYVEHPFVNQLLRYKRNQQIKSVWIDGMPLGSDMRMHAQWNPVGPRTGRWSSSPNCFDGATEVLTPHGWMRFDALDPDDHDLVAQYTDRGEVQFVKPLDYIRKRYEGPLLHLQTRAIDLLVTPDHDCLLRTRAGALEVRKANDYVEDRQQIQAGHYYGGRTLLSEAQMILLCATQADGTYHYNQVVFTFKKLRKVERLQKALETLGARYRLDQYSPGRYTFTLPAGELVSWLKDWLPAKRWTWRMLDLDSATREFFCQEIFFWDGAWSQREVRRGKLREPNQYASKERVNVDVVQTLFTLHGRKARIRRYQNTDGHAAWVVDVTQKDYSWTTNRTATEVPHTGFVYCLTMPSSHLVIRRGNCVSITNQCQNWPLWLRVMVTAPQGRRIVGADAAQLELRLAAALSGDDELIRRCMTANEDRKFEPDHDPHSYVASLSFGSGYTSLMLKDPLHNTGNRRCACQSCTRRHLRDVAKRVVYGLNYGAGAPTIREAIYDGGYDGVPITIEMIETVIKTYFKAFPGVSAWRQHTLAEAQRTGYVRDALINRFRTFPLGDVDTTIAFNFCIQSTAASNMDLGILALHSRLHTADPTAFIFAQVHDAVYVECDESAQCVRDVSSLVTECLSSEVRFHDDAVFMPLPAKAHDGADWLEAA